MTDPLTILFSDSHQLEQSKIDAKREINRIERILPIVGAHKQSIVMRATLGMNGNMAYTPFDY